MPSKLRPVIYGFMAAAVATSFIVLGLALSNYLSHNTHVTNSALVTADHALVLAQDNQIAKLEASEALAIAHAVQNARNEAIQLACQKDASVRRELKRLEDQRLDQHPSRLVRQQTIQGVKSYELLLKAGTPPQCSG